MSAGLADCHLPENVPIGGLADAHPPADVRLAAGLGLRRRDMPLPPSMLSRQGVPSSPWRRATTTKIGL